jgi:Asp/Glu/hydantoin racemase
MTLVVEPELGVQIDKTTPSIDLKDRMESAANTAKELSKHGLEVEPSKEDKDVAAKLVVAYADNPVKTSKKVTPKRVAALTPASLILTNSILQEFGRSVVESSVQIRHLVTNKLLLETDNPDPRVRIRALELLGKISDVGLFAEKSEVTITHQSTDDLREKLRSKLAKLVNPEEEIENAVIIDGEPVNVNEELGIDDSDEGFDDE